MKHIEWENELRNKICDEEDQTLFNEAISCMNSDCFRAGYVIAWISIAESLKKKIYESANLGDKQAESHYNKILYEEGKNMSVDKTIFESSKQLKLIEDHDASKLKFLWEQRCIFAHPYSKAPSEDDLKYIITASVEICLSKPLLYRKNYIDELVDNLKSKPYFLTEDNVSNIIFARRIINRIPIELHPYFFKSLLYALGMIVEDEQKIKIQGKFRMFIIELFKFTSLDLSLNEWSLEDRATNYPYTSILGFTHPDTWEKIPYRVKDIIIQYVLHESDEAKQIIIKRIVGHLSKESKLDSNHKKLFVKHLNTCDFKQAYNYYGDPVSLFNRIIAEFETGIFIKQNEVVDYLRKRDGLNFLIGLDIEKQILIGLKIMSCARENSWKSKYFINDVVKNILQIPVSVKIGIFKGSIIPSEKYLSLNVDYFKIALQIIDNLEDEDIIYSFDYIIIKIGKNEYFSVFDEKELNAISEDLPKLKSITSMKLSELLECCKNYLI
jgi:hypothetical protein